MTIYYTLKVGKRNVTDFDIIIIIGIFCSSNLFSFLPFITLLKSRREM